MLFANPDHKGEINPSSGGNSITKGQAEKDFEKMVNTQFDYNLNRKFLKLLKDAFLDVFDELADYVPGAEEKGFGNLFGLIGSSKKNVVRMEGEGQDAPSNVNKSEVKRSMVVDLPDLLPAYGQYQEQVALGNTAAGPLKKDVQDSTPQPTQENFIPSFNLLGNKSKDKAPPKLKIIAGGQYYQLYNEEQVSPRQNGDVSYPQDFEQPFGQPPTTSAPDQQPTTRIKWVRTMNPVKDYLTLLRQTVYVLLSYHGIVIREFISANDDLIIAVCYGYMPNIEKLAELLGINKQINLAVTDLMTLEPTDHKYRPLRVNAMLWNWRKWSSFYNSEEGIEKKVKRSFTEITISAVHKHSQQKKSANQKGGLDADETDLSPDTKATTVKVKQLANLDSITKNITRDNVNLDTEEDANRLPNPVTEQPNPAIDILNWDEREISVNQLRREIHKMFQLIDYKKIVRRSFGTWEKNDTMSKWGYKFVRERDFQTRGCSFEHVD